MKHRVRASLRGQHVGRVTVCRTLALALAWVGAFAALAAPAAAEEAWVRGEIRLNVRTGPGTQYRIVGTIKTGDGVEILSSNEDWTNVRLAGGDVTGWIPEGYLEAEPPPTLQLERTQAKAERLASDLGTLETEASELRKTREILSSQSAEQEAMIKKLNVENLELRAGARYPEWITGASIFAAGMVLGAMLHRSSVRRTPTRIRL